MARGPVDRIVGHDDFVRQVRCSSRSPASATVLAKVTTAPLCRTVLFTSPTGPQGTLTAKSTGFRQPDALHKGILMN